MPLIFVNLLEEEQKHFTWKQLAKYINSMPEEQQDTDVTILSIDDEYYAAVNGIYATDDEDGVLDELHPYLLLER